MLTVADGWLRGIRGVLSFGREGLTEGLIEPKRAKGWSSARDSC